MTFELARVRPSYASIQRSMPAVLVTGPITTQLAVFSPEVAETNANIHCVYPQRDDQAEWVSVACVLVRMCTSTGQNMHGCVGERFSSSFF